MENKEYVSLPLVQPERDRMYVISTWQLKRRCLRAPIQLEELADYLLKKPLLWIFPIVESTKSVKFSFLFSHISSPHNCGIGKLCYPVENLRYFHGSRIGVGVGSHMRERCVKRFPKGSAYSRPSRGARISLRKFTLGHIYLIC